MHEHKPFVERYWQPLVVLLAIVFILVLALYHPVA